MPRANDTSLTQIDAQRDSELMLLCERFEPIHWYCNLSDYVEQDLKPGGHDERYVAQA